ncbi:MAG: SHOCT domain-containing protein [Oscillospiraceae bacterium]
MSNQTSIYNEKKLAYYEATYKLSVLAKPQDVNLTLTAAHIYGLGYIMEQNGTKEGDPVYTRFSCGLDEITKVYINENSRQSPLYIQCDTMNKGVLFRKRIIIPCLKNASAVVDEILSVKKQYDEKMEKSKERAKALSRRTAEETAQEEQAQPVAAEQPEETAVQKKSFDDKLKDFERMKKLSDSFFDNIPIPGRHHASKAEAAEELPEAQKPAETAAVPEAKAPAEEAPAEAPAPEVQAAPVKETVKKKPDIKVTIDDLLQLNDSIDEDFLRNTEPPITGGKKNAEKYLDDIGGDYKYKPAHKAPERDALLSEELGEVKLEDMNEYTPGRTDELDFSDLEGVNKSDLISDMTGAKFDLEGETTPVERMDYVRKNHDRHDSKIQGSIENIKVVIDEKPVDEKPAETPAAEPESVKADEVPVLKKLPEVVLEDIAAPVAAEDAYIEDATTADTETIAAENTDDAEVPEVKNVHIDFSTEVTHDTSLDDFQESVKKLKAMLDSDLITKEEFMAEKKKLLSTLY